MTSLMNIYVHRIIYIGTHTFPSSEEPENIGKAFRSNIEQVNALYCEEFLTGFLLHFQRHFVHVLDGSEDSIKKHLDLLFENEETRAGLETIKVLVVYHNINQRFLPSWTEVFARPTHLLQKIKSDIDATEANSKILMCITKLYKFASFLKAEEEIASRASITAPPTSKHTSFYGALEEFSSTTSPPQQPSSMSTRHMSSRHLSEHKVRRSTLRFQNALPELQLMDFLVQTSFTMDLQEYMKAYGSVPLLYTFADLSWPVETDFIPRNVFDAEYDPVVEIFAPVVPSEPEIIPEDS